MDETILSVKTCKKCKKTLHLNAFSIKRSSNTKIAERCDKCRATPAVTWIERNPEKAAAATKKYKDSGGPRRARILKLYKLTTYEYDSLLAKQFWCCAICLSSHAGGVKSIFCVDHNHKTGAVRGLLCVNCNIGIGYMKDDPKNLASAIQYLLKHSHEIG